MTATNRRSFLGGLAALTASACGGSTASAPGPAVAPGLVSASRLYVADATPSLLTFPLPPIAAGNEAPAARVFGIANKLTRPVSIARDPSGALYVGEITSATIKVFAPGATGNVAPTRVIGGPSTMLTVAPALAIDGSGRLYVAIATPSGGSYAGAILRFPAGASGNTPPDLVIAGAATTLVRPNAIAVDGSGTVYVAEAAGRVKAFPAGAAGNVAPTTVSQSNTVGGPMAVDSDRTVFAIGPGSSVVSFPAGTLGGSSFTRQIFISDTGTPPPTLVSIVSIAVDATALYLADAAPNRPYVYIVPKTSNGIVSPAVIVTGINTTLGTPLAITV